MTVLLDRLGGCREEARSVGLLDITGLTHTGKKLTEQVCLDSDKRTEYRQRMLRLYDFFRFPEDLPNLALLKPPGGNARPEGIRESWYERRGRYELPPIY